MDIKKIIKQMLSSGMSEDEVKANLGELGVTDPDKVFAEATEDLKEVEVGGEAGEKPATEEESGKDEGPPEELFGGEEKPSEGFPSEEKPQAVKKATPAAKGEKPPEELFADEKESASAGGDGEVRLSDIMSGEKEAKQPDVMKKVAESSIGDLDALEAKLDETISLLTALQDINKKILETNRQVLLRLKT